MRTTITLDDDIAARLRGLRDEGSFKKLVNRALRLGLERIEQPAATPPPYRMGTASGRPLLSNIDNIGRILDELDEAHDARP